MIIEVVNNNTRYKRIGDKWSINASTGSLITEPYTFDVPTKILELHPVLSNDVTLIVKIEDMYLCSQDVYTDLIDSKDYNPHYWYDTVTKVKTNSGTEVVIGNTIPIIELNLKSIKEAAEIEGIMLPFTGVKEVQWVFDKQPDEDPNVPIAQKLIDQINYTLSSTSERPADDWDLWDLNLAANYTNTQMPVLSPSTDKAVVDKNLLTKNLEELNKRVVNLRKDFNDIKRIYYSGKVKDSSVTSTHYTSLVLGSSAPETEVKDENKSSVTYKSTELISVDKNSTDKRTEALDTTINATSTELKAELQDTKTTTQEALNTQAENLKRAQAGDAEAQRQLAAELKAANQRTTDLANKIPNPGK